MRKIGTWVKVKNNPDPQQIHSFYADPDIERYKAESNIGIFIEADIEYEIGWYRVKEDDVPNWTPGNDPKDKRIKELQNILKFQDERILELEDELKKKT